MNKQSTNTFHGVGKDAWGSGVEQTAEFNVCFSLVHIGVGRTVYNDIHLLLFHYLSNRFTVGNVQQCSLYIFCLHHIREDIVVR